MEYLRFKTRCPLCAAPLDDIRVPAGMFGGGGKCCRSCGNQVSYFLSTPENALHVRMTTMPAGRATPEELVVTTSVVETQ